jgi:hypothetical protein
MHDKYVAPHLTKATSRDYLAFIEAGRFRWIGGKARQEKQMTDFTASLAPFQAEKLQTRSMWRRIVTKLVDARTAQVRHELARHGIHFDETAIVNGPYRRVGLSQADILPFTD